MADDAGLAGTSQATRPPRAAPPVALYEAGWPCQVDTRSLPSIGLLTERSLSAPHIEALRRGLTELGWVEGRSFRIEQRSAEGNLDRLPGLAAELVSSGAAVIVTGVGSPAALAAKRATTTVPIVFVTGGDAVDFGIVPNRLKPGGNVTGLGGGIVAIQERLEMLRDMAPRTKRVAFHDNLHAVARILQPPNAVRPHEVTTIVPFSS